METRHLLLYLSVKYNGDWDKIYNAIKNKEGVNTDEVERVVNECKSDYVTILDEDFPEPFKKIHRTPFVLYYKGDYTLLSNPKCLAVVGTRNPTNYGLYTTRKIISELNKDIVIVSGLARGIDKEAHLAAMKNDLKTIAFLGCGINYIYPVDNYQIYKDIENNGLLISEYPDMVEPDKKHFPIRNRLIAGISRGVLVTEAKNKSGTVITVNNGLSYGKNIYAVPHPISDDEDNLCNNLIHDGALMVRSGADINYDF